MNFVSHNGSSVAIDGVAFQMRYSILEAFVLNGKAIVLLNPDDYLNDKQYRNQISSGGPSLRNLVAVDAYGRNIWEAELPEKADYYFRVISKSPLVALSFSSFRCHIDESNGKVVAREFLK